MRTWSAVVVATAFVAGAAVAQMKLPQQPATTTSAAPLVLSGEPSLESAKRIKRDEAIEMVKQHKAVWIDVRARESFDQEHIPGAISIPEAELKAKVKDLPKNKYLITYCAWQQEHTSARAVLDLNALGIKNTAALLGGWNEWKAAGLPTEKIELK